MLQIVTTVAAAIVLATQVALAQTQPPMQPTTPGAPGDPAWQGIARLSDGRTFVTDGGLAIDAALAKPPRLPTRELAAKVLEGYLAAAGEHEYSLDDLRVGERSKTYVAPSGVVLNATYIAFLRKILPPAAIRLRLTGASQPVVIMSNDSAVGVLMPVKK